MLCSARAHRLPHSKMHVDLNEEYIDVRSKRKLRETRKTLIVKTQTSAEVPKFKEETSFWIRDTWYGLSEVI